MSAGTGRGKRGVGSGSGGMSVRSDASSVRNVEVSFLKEREKAQGFAETVRIGAEK